MKKETKNISNLKVSAIIPNFNGEELLKKNLPHVFKAFNNKKNNLIEIIIVDDASTDGSVDLLKENFPDVRVIRYKKNRGFSSAVNMGVRMAKGDLVALLNTDVVPEENFLVSTLRNFKNEKVFAVSLHEKGFGWAKASFCEGFINHEGRKQSKKTQETFWVNGGSGIFRRSMWMKLGGLDEKLLNPFYWEDIDICYRAAKRGWLLLWEPDAKVTHEHESTIGKLSQRYRRRIQERNQLLVIWKNITSPQLFKKHLVGLSKRLSRHPGYVRIVLSALLKIKEVLKARKKEAKEGRVSDEAIFARFNRS